MGPRIVRVVTHVLLVVGMLTGAGIAGKAAAHAANARYLASGDVVVRLDSPLPESGLACRTVAVTQEKWDADALARTFSAQVADVAVPGNADVGASRWVRLGDAGLVRMGAGGGFYATMQSGVAASCGVSCDASRAVQVAREYVAAHGGLPVDAELWSVREIKAVGLSLSTTASAGAEESRTRVVGRYVEFKHQFGGLLIDSPSGGDCIKVRVDGSGRVTAYGRNWRRVSEPGGDRQPVRFAAREALGRAIGQPGRAQSKSRLVGQLSLKDCRLVYLSASRETRVDALRPAWRFVIEAASGRQAMYVDATSGEVVEVD